MLAHGMLTSVSVAVAALKLLIRDDLRPEDRRQFGEAAIVRLDLVTDILREIARGLPPEALVLLQGGAPPAPPGLVDTCGTAPADARI